MAVALLFRSRTPLQWNSNRDLIGVIIFLPHIREAAIKQDTDAEFKLEESVTLWHRDSSCYVQC
jgi:hypothetical protein